jgi:two-component system, sensor histidine kinase and response regulator
MENKAHILIVDDNADNIQLAASVLKVLDININFAMGGYDALNSLSEQKVDLILMDINMPDMDGFTATKKIKEQNNLKDIPILFLTAHNDEDKILQGFDLGGVDYITKPFRPKELIARVKTHLELHLSKVQIKKDAIQKQHLLKELYHRVKNNLQVISGFLSLQMTHKENPELKQCLQESNLRIKSMSRVHEKLYIGEAPELIDVKKYLNDLISECFQIYSFDNTTIWSLQGDSVQLSISDATILGLIVNEIINNAFKYAFKNVEKPKIEFSIYKEDKNNKIIFIAKDNGLGTISGKKEDSLGRKIIEALSLQLEATLKLDTKDGYLYQLTIPTGEEQCE